MSLVQSSNLSVRWIDGKAVLSNLRSRNRLRVTANVLSIINRVASPVDLETLLAEYPEVARPAIQTLLEELLQLGFIESTDGFTGEACKWAAAFGPDALAFHHATLDVGFVPFRSERSSELAKQFAQDSQPARVKHYPQAKRVYLPRLLPPLLVPLDDAFSRRRTHRDFTARPVSLNDLTTVLARSFGATNFQDTGPLGTQLVKASPAGGSRHDVEAYVLAYNISELEAAIYHYNTLEHSLEFVAPLPDREYLLPIVASQPHAVDSGFSVFMTSVLTRIAYKYRHPRAYRTWMYNAGHVAQTFALAATAVNLGPFQTAAFEDSQVSELLNLDPSEEFPTYLVGAGHPVLSSSGLPRDFRPAQPSSSLTQERHDP
ncbi:SagB/ThcOx family dehydrogenase [Rathayibacter iranicus]|uniref:SagB-type dehydrogenase family enzyme n=1 Tax=Rathayibacter iranicus NCPPB 2253 = VKM Ac-1602 TaxID=1328868 RepID=A0ABX5LBJ5_9MICO|nr:SagB-type dehydrogenase family enzyme [Rathayibacter iranicus NCPPB 2253 = VKM Ac-1602]